jgi:tetratricopeptide (TPR) repeat protein/transcriptional regulator with XRE-family HTH domain
VADRGDFGAQLRARRIAAKLSQEELAEQSGVSVRAISNLERGKTRWPHPGSVQRLADALDLTGQTRAEFIDAASRRLPSAAPGKAAPVSGGRVVPRQLPPAVPAFAGRSSELATLSRVLTRPGGTAVITAIGGTAGVGKTTLALRWGHQVAAEFPDGQLYVNLRGFGPSDTPASPGDAVRILLEGLDVAPERLPHSEEAQLNLYRSLLVGKRMLIVLDNARDEAQVRPLLPGSLTCRVVVTSRNLLAGLTALDAAHPLLLDVLTESEAWDLLKQRLGSERLHADDDAVCQIIKACAYLPLALSIVAARAALRPDLPLTSIAAELITGQGLDAFTAGEPAADVRAVLSWSYRQLEDDAARIFRLAGLHPGADFDRYAAAALTGMTVERAEEMLTTLAGGCLIQVTGPGRYGMHDLLREYARELSATNDSKQERQTALTALFDHYLYTTATAVDFLFPAARHLYPRIPMPATAVPPIADPAAARQWLDGERAALTAAAGHTADHGWPGHTTLLAVPLARYLYFGGHIPGALTILGHALDAARRTGDRVAEAMVLRQIGAGDVELGRPQQAADHYRQALALFRAADDRSGEAQALGSMGHAETGLGRYEQAARHIQEAVAIFRDIGDRFGEARSLGNLGLVRQRQGRYQEAADYQKLTADLCREVCDRQGEAFALARLGVIDLRLGRHQPAAGYLRQALTLFEELSNKTSACEVLVKLGDVYAALGRTAQAAGNYEQVVAISREIGHLTQEADALNCLGELLLRTGEPAQARARHSAALRLASETDAASVAARAHAGLGAAHNALGNHAKAIRHWRLAHDAYVKMGAPEAEDIRNLLDS